MEDLFCRSTACYIGFQGSRHFDKFERAGRAVGQSGGRAAGLDPLPWIPKRQKSCSAAQLSRTGWLQVHAALRARPSETWILKSKCCPIALLFAGAFKASSGLAALALAPATSSFGIWQCNLCTGMYQLFRLTLTSKIARPFRKPPQSA